MTPLVIPHRGLAPDTLTALLEDFVTRDSTDYGEHDVPVAARVGQVRRQLDAGKAVIVYDAEAESFNIVPSDQAALLRAARPPEP